ncbi:response regulator transcription factor [Paraburkholderia aromaticivorans]|uniref:response regulator transcription factor n=1 Tax=Paraburkholderia aromaticivorans TaxID=2026199 RepID=UPI001455F932|nr:response regulator [Paraburkholderia aromaticivorans]
MNTATTHYNLPESRKIVYIVDDDESVRVSLRWLLESVGHTVEVYANGREFLSAAKPNVPGCLLLDVRMPQMGGFELQESLRATGFRLPIIFLTAHGDIPMTVRALKSGAYDFLEKPYNDQQLIDKVSEALKISCQLHQQAKNHSQTSELLKQLSAREREVFELLIKGNSSKLIAIALGISHKTVEVHRAHIREKLRMTSLAELVRLGIEEVNQRQTKD